MRKQTKMFEAGLLTIKYVKQSDGSEYFYFDLDGQPIETFQREDIADLVEWLGAETGLIAGRTTKKVEHVPTKLEIADAKALKPMEIEEALLPSPDELSKRTAGGMDKAAKLKVGDAFKNPGDYADGKKAIHGVEKADLGAFAAGQAILEVNPKLM